MYLPPVELPSTKTISFGYGKKTTLINQTDSPSPDRYVLRREFDSVRKGISFGLGREDNRFGDPLGDVRRKLPGVGSYRIGKDILGETQGGYIGKRFGSCFEKRRGDDGPGPGEY